MNVIQIIEKKRDGKELSEREIRYLVDGVVSGKITDYQMAAWLMAVFFRGMNFEEMCFFTQAMIDSGVQVNLDHLDRFPVDKHSTGGVGDKVSLVLAPLVAQAGIAVPMMSGRGLGHSGGTLDKLESIPGFRTNLTLREFVSQLENIFVAMIGQTGEMVPADRKIYALRDSTGTVASIPLVVASILSKKIAEGAKALVLDVKTGKGAFFRSEKESLDLAKNLITVGAQLGIKISALLTLMDQPLGNAVGNWLETKEAIETLKGKGPVDLKEITLALGAEMLCQARVALDFMSAKKRLADILDSGKAYELFVKLVEAQGGDVTCVERPEQYPASKSHIEISSPETGIIKSVDALKIGLLANELGAGRKRMTDKIDYAAGIVLQKKEGDSVEKGELLADVYYSKSYNPKDIEKQLMKAVNISSSPPKEKRKLILKYITKDAALDWDQ